MSLNVANEESVSIGGKVLRQRKCQELYNCLCQASLIYCYCMQLGLLHISVSDYVCTQDAELTGRNYPKFLEVPFSLSPPSPSPSIFQIP